MSWFWLVLAGLLEVIWAIGLKYTDGFSQPIPSLITLVAMGLSFFLLSVALRTLPLGTAYAVWVGIGVVGTTIVGIVLLDEAVTTLKLLSLLLVVAGVIGLKLASSV